MGTAMKLTWCRALVTAAIFATLPPAHAQQQQPSQVRTQMVRKVPLGIDIPGASPPLPGVNTDLGPNRESNSPLRGGGVAAICC